MVNAQVQAQGSCGGILALLDDEDVDLQAYALEQLNATCHLFWPEISEAISKIEILYEDTSFKNRQLAALVAAKVFYYLGDLEDALTFALGAGSLFDVDKVGTDQFVETIVAACIDRYIRIRSKKLQEPSTSAIPSESDQDNRLKKIVERMLERCIRDKEYKHAVGIALEAQRLDVLDRVFDLAPKSDASLLKYTLDTLLTLGDTQLDLRNTVLRNLLQRFHHVTPEPDYFSITQCLVYLEDGPQLAAELLNTLLSQSSDKSDPKALVAFQVAFDLADAATQEFLNATRSAFSPATSSETNGAQNESNAAQSPSTNSPSHAQVLRILTGEESVKLYLDFLQSNNHADLLILSKTKGSLEARNSVFHSALTFANAFSNAGTTSDKFLRENLDWLGKASNWSKFSATAALGVIHKGNLAQGRAVLGPYLPPPEGQPSTSAYSEGGSLYALGLIHANHGSGVLEYLVNQLKQSTNEVVQHGAALGLGVAGMATGDEDIYEALKTVLFTDNAVAGEAAGYAMGLVMLGTTSTKPLEEMLSYAHETQHEKIIRGLAIGMAFLMYGKQEGADELIETLSSEKDPILRYGGVYTIALAYAGTSNNKATRKLLHIAVSDVDDNVRRAAVIALGFILFRNPAQVPRMVQLLAESYNSNVRYGAALALGISCAGTGSEDAVEILEPLTKDPVDFVRQAACIALAMVLIQQNDTTNPKVGAARKIFENLIGDKHEDAMAKLGATLAQGFIDAGGRNVNVSMQSKSGSSSMPAIVGLALFSQFWYWFPLAHAACLAFTPTAIIGVNYELKTPKFEFISQARPSLFAYPPETKVAKKEQIQKVETAVLSTTAKASARAKTKENQKAASSMDTDEKPEPQSTERPSDETAKKVDAMDTDQPSAKQQEGSAKTKKGKAEFPSEKKPNMSRVLAAQLPYIIFPSDARYTPVRSIIASNKQSSKQNKPSSAAKTSRDPAAFSLAQSLVSGGGIFVMRDNKPDEPAEFINVEREVDAEPVPTPAAATPATTRSALDVDMESPIADPPAAFEYDF